LPKGTTKADVAGPQGALLSSTPMGLGETARLLGEALHGEPEARGTLLEHLRPRLVLWIASRMSAGLRALVEPEDLAQETLLAIHRGMDRFDGQGHKAFLSWVFTIAENRIRDAVDYHGAEKRKKPDPLSFTQTSPSGAAAREESVQRVRRAVESLPEDHREVVRLRRFEELEYPQVAEIMGRTENAVRVLYCRALKALKGLMNDGAAS
jgi:RNA polymerase sigma-70 factor (ECF subfamily)